MVKRVFSLHNVRHTVCVFLYTVHMILTFSLFFSSLCYGLFSLYTYRMQSHIGVIYYMTLYLNESAQFFSVSVFIRYKCKNTLTHIALNHSLALFVSVPFAFFSLSFFALAVISISFARFSLSFSEALSISCYFIIIFSQCFECGKCERVFFSLKITNKMLKRIFCTSIRWKDACSDFGFKLK